MGEYITSIKNDKQLLAQIIFVFAAFFVMVLIGSIFGGNIIDKNVEAYGNEVVATAGARIYTYLEEYMIILDDVAVELDTMVENGADTEEIREVITARTEWFKETSRKHENFSGFYGVINGVFISGSGWDPMNPESEDYDPNYIPQLRPWHTGAIYRSGKTNFTNPYIDADTGELVMTISKEFVGSDRRHNGVIAMDIFYADIAEVVSGLTLLNSGYGILLDSDRRIISTQQHGIIGIILDEVDSDHAAIGTMLDTQGGVVHHNVTHNNESYVEFFTQIPNGWYVGVAAARSSYYSDRVDMVVALSIFGLLLSVPLCFVLVYLHVKKARADAANSLKTSFLANMSHEIRTPMNAIIGMTELLQNETLNEQQVSYVKDINSSAQNLLSIINDILDLSKIEAGKTELHPVDFDFPAFLDNIASVFSYVTSEKGLEFSLEKIGDMPDCLFGDDVRLRQVLTNLCGNAVKFTNEGSVCLTVTVRGWDIDFEIKDTGMGIREEDLSKIFNPFEQLDMHNNRKIIGTGLGLPISKNFIEMMGGSIRVESVYGEGTTFTVTIPLVPGDRDNAQRLKTSDELKAFAAPSARVLIVDDNEVNLKVASGLLKNLYKIEAQTVLSGQEAIELVKENDYDVIFMDHMMPEMDGVQTVCEIRKLGGKHKTVKIIALTANAIAGVREMFMANGFDGFISKPINTAELNAVLAGALPEDKMVAGEDASSQLSGAGGGGADTHIGEVITALENIDAINAEIALSRVSGIPEMLVETLELFYNKLPGECERLSQFDKSGDLENFAISVHGLKSALSAVGAMELSEAAFEMEKASKSGDALFCGDHLPDFLVKLKALHGELVEVFPEGSGGAGGEGTDKAAGDAELLKEKVQLAIDACDNFDDAAGLEALDALLGFDYGEDVNALLSAAKAAIKEFDYDTALDALNAVKG